MHVSYSGYPGVLVAWQVLSVYLLEPEDLLVLLYDLTRDVFLVGIMRIKAVACHDADIRVCPSEAG